MWSCGIPSGRLTKWTKKHFQRVCCSTRQTKTAKSWEKRRRCTKFDVETIKIFKNQGGADFLPEEDTILVCSTFKPFSSPANGTVSGCNAGDAVSIAPGGTERFVAVLVFNEDDVFIANRSYRLRIASNDGLELSTKYPTTATSVYTGESCGIPAAGFDGAWVHAKEL